MISNNEIEYEGKNYKLKTTNALLRFSCDKCGSCCKDIDIILTPYDVIKICDFIKITTTEFLSKYCEWYIGHDSHFPIVILKTRPNCVFNKGLCTIHSQRPFRCRLYPAGRVTILNKEDNSSEIKYFVHNNCSKIPLRQQKLQTIKKWLIDQEVEEYARQISKFNELVTGFVMLKLPESEAIAVTLLLVAYDFDKNEKIRQINEINEKYDMVLGYLKDILDKLKPLKEVIAKE